MIYKFSDSSFGTKGLFIAVVFLTAATAPRKHRNTETVSNELQKLYK